MECWPEQTKFCISSKDDLWFYRNSYLVETTTGEFDKWVEMQFVYLNLEDNII
jgi:hypothetical protein